MANGEWRMANGKWQMANGEWQMANGKWQMANGKWRIQIQIYTPSTQLCDIPRTCQGAAGVKRK
jgi:hypothetical protein